MSAKTFEQWANENFPCVSSKVLEKYREAYELGRENRVGSALYYRFDEQNDHEGETWTFFIPVEGNEKAVDELENVLLDLDAAETEENGYCEMPYQFCGTLTEAEVDVLIEHTWGDGGYMDRFHKLSGKLDLSKLTEPRNMSNVFNDLYKGSIRQMMQED